MFGRKASKQPSRAQTYVPMPGRPDVSVPLPIAVFTHYMPAYTDVYCNARSTMDPNEAMQYALVTVINGQDLEILGTFFRGLDAHLYPPGTADSYFDRTCAYLEEQYAIVKARDDALRQLDED